jgi:hypothetical protein
MIGRRGQRPDVVLLPFVCLNTFLEFLPIGQTRSGPLVPRRIDCHGAELAELPTQGQEEGRDPQVLSDVLTGELVAHGECAAESSCSVQSPDTPSVPRPRTAP